MSKYAIYFDSCANGIYQANVGLISWVTYSFFVKPELRRDTTLVVSTAGCALALLGLEGYAAESYARTPEGRAEKQKAKERGSSIYHHTKEVVLRPGVLGGLVGIGKEGHSKPVIQIGRAHV